MGAHILVSGLLLSVHLTALTGLFALSLSGGLPPLLFLSGVIGIVWSFVWAVRRKGQIFPPQGWTLLTFCVFLLFLLTVAFFSHSFFPAVLYLLVYLIINKLFTLRSSRDYFQFFLTSFLGLVSSAAFTTDLSYAFACLLYLFSITWAMICYHLTMERDTVPSFPPPFFFATNAVILFSVGMTLLMFFLIPRVGVGFFHKRQEKQIRVSGFSDKVDFGSLGPLKLDSTVVMRVVLPEARGEGPFYLRGAAFDLYDGLTWKNSFSTLRRVGKDPEGFLISKPEGKKLTLQEIFLEPLDTQILFAASYPVVVKGEFPFLSSDPMGALYFPSYPSNRLHYIVYSAPPSDEGTPEDRYLHVPPLDKKIEEQFGAIVQTVVKGKGETPYEKAKAIEEFLTMNFVYSLAVSPPPPGRSLVEDFFFYQKKGYCEHFATAMVMMLRTLGIPARFVTGFLGSEWNDFGGYYTIKQKDAHSWVEAYIPSRGWVIFDPTPPTADPISILFLNTLSHWIDSLRLSWHRYIINYTFLDQIRLFGAVRDQIEDFTREISRWFASLKNFSRSPVILLILSFLLLPFFFRAGWRKGVLSLWKLRRGQEKRGIEFYQRMLALLEKRGYVKKKQMTPREFAEWLVQKRGEICREAFRVTELYYRVRFGGRGISCLEHEEVEKILTSLFSTLRERRSAR